MDHELIALDHFLSLIPESLPYIGNAPDGQPKITAEYYIDDTGVQDLLRDALRGLKSPVIGVRRSIYARWLAVGILAECSPGRHLIQREVAVKHRITLMEVAAAAKATPPRSAALEELRKEVAELRAAIGRSLPADPPRAPMAGEPMDLAVFQKDMFWYLLTSLESKTNPNNDILDKNAVNDAYKLFNCNYGTKHSPRWTSYDALGQ